MIKQTSLLLENVHLTQIINLFILISFQMNYCPINYIHVMTQASSLE